MVLHTHPFPSASLRLLNDLSWGLIYPCYWLLDHLGASFLPTSQEQRRCSQDPCASLTPCVLLFTPLYLLLTLLWLPVALLGFVLWAPLQAARRPYAYSHRRFARGEQGSAEWGPPGRSFCFSSANVCLLPDSLARLNNLADTRGRAGELGRRIFSGAGRPRIKIYVDSPTSASASSASSQTFSLESKPNGHVGGDATGPHDKECVLLAGQHTALNCPLHSTGQPIPDCPLHSTGQPVPDCPLHATGKPIPNCPLHSTGQHTLPDCPLHATGQHIPNCPLHSTGQPIPNCPLHATGQHTLPDCPLHATGQHIPNCPLHSTGQPIPNCPLHATGQHTLPDCPLHATGQPIPDCPLHATGQPIPNCPLHATGQHTLPDCPLHATGQPIPDCPLHATGQPIPDCPLHATGQHIPNCPLHSTGQHISPGCPLHSQSPMQHDIPVCLFQSPVQHTRPDCPAHSAEQPTAPDCPPHLTGQQTAVQIGINDSRATSEVINPVVCDAGNPNGCITSRDSLTHIHTGNGDMSNDSSSHHNSALRKCATQKRRSADDAFDHEISAFFPANLDFLCLQEVFDKQAAVKLKQQLHHYFPFILSDVGRYAWKGCCSQFKFLNSGLLLASQYPILDADYHCFANGRGEDALAAKGVLFVKVQVGKSSQGMIIVGYITCTHLHSIEGDSLVRCEQLNALLEYGARFRKMTKWQKDQVAFDVILGDLNFDNCSSEDRFEQHHVLFSRYKDPCRLGPGEDQPWALGTLLEISGLYDEEVCSPEKLQKVLGNEEGRREYLVFPAGMKHCVNQEGRTIPLSGNGRRIDYILYSEEGLQQDWKVGVEEYSFITQLAGLTDHLAVAMRLAVSVGEEPSADGNRT